MHRSGLTQKKPLSSPVDAERADVRAEVDQHPGGDSEDEEAVDEELRAQALDLGRHDVSDDGAAAHARRVREAPELWARFAPAPTQVAPLEPREVAPVWVPEQLVLVARAVFDHPADTRDTERSEGRSPVEEMPGPPALAVELASGLPLPLQLVLGGEAAAVVGDEAVAELRAPAHVPLEEDHQHEAGAYESHDHGHSAGLAPEGVQAMHEQQQDDGHERHDLWSVPHPVVAVLIEGKIYALYNR
mmetsp:Transcript_1996/g.5289  ORF Transcript_1996/g.5289 Transcript_1996/m.5289 type:complete len:245 (+) Transcript_1996:2-736(+)